MVEISRLHPSPQPPPTRGGGVSIRVKICGVTSTAAFDAVVAAGADWIGFNFFPPSPRFVTPAQAAALSARAGGPLRVGLFVDPEDSAIEAALAALRLDVIQLYAPAARAADIRARFGVPVWRAVGVVGRADLPGPEPAIDGHLIESKPPKGASRPGGNAVSFDWTVAADWSAPLPWLLAGGLTPENVGQAIAASGAAAVDVSSGVESAPGVKDPELIAAFVANARATLVARAAAESAAAGSASG
jgi:phosphoribosylanthranilate isomerase